jgi:hypothetical protein
MFIKKLLFLLAFLHFIDIGLTLIGVSTFGIHFEGNDLVKNLIINNLIWLWILLKIILIGLLFFIIYYFMRVKKRLSLIWQKIVYCIIIFTLIYLNVFVLYACIGWIYGFIFHF